MSKMSMKTRKRVVNISDGLDLSDNLENTPVKEKCLRNASTDRIQRPSGARSILSNIYKSNRALKGVTTSKVIATPKESSQTEQKKTSSVQHERTSTHPTLRKLITTPSSQRHQEITTNQETPTHKDPTKTPSASLQTPLSLPTTQSTPTSVASTSVTPSSSAASVAEHSNCSAKILELTRTIQRVNESRQTEQLAKSDHFLARSVYKCLHKEYDIIERFDSSHNSEVSVLYINALTRSKFSTAQAVKLCKLCYLRVKNHEKPISATVKACRMKSNKKNNKLRRRKNHQSAREKELFPLVYELMSSDDEDEDGPIQRTKSYITEEAKRHVEELDCRAKKNFVRRTVVVAERPPLKLFGNKCIKW